METKGSETKILKYVESPLGSMLTMNAGEFEAELFLDSFWLSAFFSSGDTGVG